MAASLATDVLILGAGPAGSSAAASVARAGFSVVLVDRYAFPRDKVCGDALIPDALEAVKHLGLEPAVEARARVLNAIHIYAPDGRHVSLAGRSACLPRRVFDEMLRANAVAAGASFMAPLNITCAIGNPRVEGAVLEDRLTREAVEVRAKVTILATGAGVDGLNRLSVVERKEPTAVALRAYYAVPDDLAAGFDHLCISYDRSIAPGYGWIFPGPGNVFNVGVGYFTDSVRGARAPEPSRLWLSFTRDFGPAADLVSRSRPLSAPKGAPLRTAMTGARFWRPGLLVAGEAAGLTYSFSGEGIGKAMASGLMAGQLAADHLAGRLTIEELGPAYARGLASFAPRFEAYLMAQKWLGSPRFANFLAARANRSRFVRTELEGLFNETGDPRKLFSAMGVLRSLLGPSHPV